jgi:transcription elongation GreA/GreB family factor
MTDQELREIVDEVMEALEEEDLPENAQYTTYYAVGEENEPTGW